MKIIGAFLVIVLSMITVPSAFAEGAVVRSAAQVLDQPSIKGVELGQLSSGQSVAVIERKGIWLKISEPMLGWVKIRHVSLGQAQPVASTLSGLKSGREGAGNAVSSTGVRGLDAEMIKLAEPDYGALEGFVALELPAEEAKKFASSAFELRSLSYMPAPQTNTVDSRDIGDTKERSAQPRGGGDREKRVNKRKKVVEDDDW